jgi:hypothetical protein
MALVMWTRYFLEAQGYLADDNVVYQDNQSAMAAAKKECGSSGKWTRHINIGYFFVADQIESNKMRVDYCPTGDMIGNFFTKALQGASFRKFRDLILNIKQEDFPKYRSIMEKYDASGKTDPSQGCVEERVQTKKVNKVIHDSTRRAATWKGSGNH